ncbi:MAG TPA: lytic transglycosylase domain-containing protein [Candidatus Atribacteria bacterium]|nr:lytic transglycosylase domain-containing protein [Candidatus Atribacteria bacterium]
MSNEKNKGEKYDISNSFRENINKNLGLIFIIFMGVIITLFITLQIKINYLNMQTEKQIENINLKNEKIINQIEDLYKEIKQYSQVKIDREQFTEIYMQLQELTGMISNEVKREYYINKIVRIISQNNKKLESKDIYEIAKTIYEESIKHNFNPLLVTAIIKVESNFDPKAISDSYAYGLCQVRRFIAPELANNIGIKWDGAEKTLFDPIKNIKIGVYYLSMLNRDFDDIKTAIIAYNQGPYSVQENLAKNNELNQNYANKVLDYYANLRGFSMEEIENEIGSTD